MGLFHKAIIACCALVIIAAATAAEDRPKKEKWIQLFNGKNLDGWKPKITGHELNDNFGNTFRVEDGVMKVGYDKYENFGGKFGHIFYEQPFSHYIIRVEYRFTGDQVPGGPGWAIRNSGIMVHGQSPESMEKAQKFPVSIEVQLLGGNGKDKRATANLCTPGTHVVMNGKLHKPHCTNSKSKTYHGSQWVTVEVEVRGSDSIKHVVNGETVMVYENPQYDEGSAKKFSKDGNKLIRGGSISLQSESHPVEFRKVELLPLEPGPSKSADSSAGILAPDAKVQLLAEGFKFTEGPACDAVGNVYFTDQPNDRIIKWSVDGKLSTFMKPCGRSNGLCFDSGGNLWACADEKNQLWCIAPNGDKEVVIEDYQGKLLNGPNDIWIHPKGGVYFTDPFYKRPYWDRGPSEQGGQCVYYMSTDRKLTRAAEGLRQPNGIIGTPDGKLLYVADIRAGKTYSYKIGADGSLAGKKLFCEMGSDGMTIDRDGNVYLTGRGVTVFDPSGKRIQNIPIDADWTANVCFGGKDRQTLFVTAKHGLFAVATRVQGVGSQ